MDNSPKEFKVIVRYNKNFFIPLNFDELKTEFITDDPYKLIEELKQTAVDISATKNQIKTALINNDYSEASDIANKHNATLWMIKGADVYKNDKLQQSFDWL